MSDLQQALIEAHLKTLKLPGIRSHYQQMARQAGADSWSFQDYLRELLEIEVGSRSTRVAAQRLREARFPEVKTFEQLNWQVLQGVSKTTLLQLATCAYLEKAEDLIIAGPIGTGKFHLAVALGVEAAKRRFRVLFVRAADLVRELLEARDDRALGRFQVRLAGWIY